MGPLGGKVEELDACNPWQTACYALRVLDMTNLETNILESLIELDMTVKTMRAANPKPNLQALFQRLDTLTGQLPEGTDPKLLHYLQGKSYEKARLFLQGRDTENAEGSCH